MAKSCRYTRRTDHGFDVERFKPVRNCTWHAYGVKPQGGLWLSINEDWERFTEAVGLPRYGFEISPNAKVLTVDSLEVLQSLPIVRTFEARGKTIVCLDFEALSKSYDLIEVILHRPELYRALDGWDVDSAIVFNPDVITSWEEIEPYYDPDLE